MSPGAQKCSTTGQDNRAGSCWVMRRSPCRESQGLGICRRARARRVVVAVAREQEPSARGQVVTVAVVGGRRESQGQAEVGRVPPGGLRG